MTEDERKIALYRRVNGFTGPLARSRWYWRTRWLARLLAQWTWWKNRGQAQQEIGAMAEEWRRLFGLPGFWQIERVEEEVAYAAIRFPCALEGSGDVAACQRLMEYDCALLRKIGGQLLVLESRADPKVRGACKVAIHRRNDLHPELIPAHLLE